MLKVSFSINNIQNTLQRQYRRGQTILSLEQNVLEGRGEIRDDFVKIIKIIIKNNTGQTVLSFDQKSKLLRCFLFKTLLKEKSAEPDLIKLAFLRKK